eukprot:gene3841-4433_t
MFHADEGLIYAATMYPVKDRFQGIKVKGVLTYHGHIKWFRGRSFEELTGFSLVNELGELWNLSNVMAILTWCLITLLFSVVAGALLYKFCLKPRLIRKYLKTD